MSIMKDFRGVAKKFFFGRGSDKINLAHSGTGVLNVKLLVGAFNQDQEQATVGAFS